MRFLIDQDVFAATTRLLRDLGHDVVTVSELGLSRAVDSDLLVHARTNHRIFITRDRDFGRLIFAKRSGAGVIYLRVTPTTVNAIHRELERLLSLYAEEKLLELFVVVEPMRHRLRRISP
jgi:predicted nuclease of predicted toxin-antitoxin system